MSRDYDSATFRFISSRFKKKVRHIVPMAVSDWRVTRLKKLKESGNLGDEEIAKLELLEASLSAAQVCFIVYCSKW